MFFTLLSEITSVIYSNFMESNELFGVYHFIPRKKYFLVLRHKIYSTIEHLIHDMSSVSIFFSFLFLVHLKYFVWELFTSNFLRDMFKH